MRISTKGRYGLRGMLELARSFGEGPLLMNAIAERQGLSRKHLHALLTSLKSAGLVSSIRGPGGGFVLTKAPSKIRLSAVLRALEGPLMLVHCVSDGRACDRVNRCTARKVWQKLNSVIDGVLDGVTLADLVSWEVEAHLEPGGNKEVHRTSAHTAPSGRRSGAAAHRPSTKAAKK